MMKTNRMSLTTVLAGLLVGVGLALPQTARAHCDTMDGPVVLDARTALEKKDVTAVLKWVNPEAEAEIKAAFAKTLAVRTKGTEARELADQFFFETLVRIHRAGEGAGYTGLKPAGSVEPPVAAADKAIETGKLQPLGKLVSDRMEKGLHAHFDEVMAKRKYDANDVAAGRAYSSAYVEFTHYAERLYNAAETMAPEHGH